MDKKVLAGIKVVVGLAVPACLLWLPADFFDTGPPVCFSQWVFKTPCLGCGTTRSVMHLLHGELAAAWALNPLGFAVLPALAAWWAYWFIGSLREIKASL